MSHRAAIGTFLIVTILNNSGELALGEEPRYQVPRLEEHLTLDANWKKPVWQAVQPIELTHFMGKRPSHFPHTQAKLLYDDQALYVIFQVEDRYVRAVVAKNQGDVYFDSCVEFFFVPAANTTTAYFNLEMNCGGTMLLHFQTIPRDQPEELSADELSRIEVAHSQPKIVDPETSDPTIWTVEYRLPFAILKRRYSNALQPAPGVEWRANFYKCADGTSHPHWLTWAKVDHPSPHFHLPKFFGTLEFQ